MIRAALGMAIPSISRDLSINVEIFERLGSAVEFGRS